MNLSTLTNVNGFEYTLFGLLVIVIDDLFGVVVGGAGFVRSRA